MRKAWGPPELWVAVLALGLALSLTVVPGVFTADDNNYLINVLALREGRVTVANTEGLSPSQELLFFDPGPWSRAVERTPVASTAPPLYAAFALPFSVFGWRGLVALNTVAYLATAVMVFWYARKYGEAPQTPWFAAGAFALGGFAIEYAQGVWPHMLSVALCTGAIVAAGRLIDGGRLSLAAVAGLLLALAAGVRYQNVVLLGAVGVGIAFWAPRRPRAILAFVFAASLPLTTASIINHERLDSWNPISKGKGYLNVQALQEAKSSPLDPVVMFWAQLVDYSARPPLRGPAFDSWLAYDSATGAHLMLFVTVKKAFLQSAPWAILGFTLFLLAWVPAFPMPRGQRHQLLLMSLVTGVIVGMFSLAGVRRHDGYSFNARYLLEVVPLAALGFAWSLERAKVRILPLAIGGSLGVVVVLAILIGTPIVRDPAVPLWTTRQMLILKMPLLFAAVLAGLWIAGREGQRARTLLAAVTGACVGWAFTIHLADDVWASQRSRRSNLVSTQELARTLPDGSALVAWWWQKDPAVPLLFSRDIVILDVNADAGTDAPVLIRELLSKGRRVFLIEDDLPAEVRDRVVSGLLTTPVPSERLRLRELRVGSE